MQCAAVRVAQSLVDSQYYQRNAVGPAETPSREIAISTPIRNAAYGYGAAAALFMGFTKDSFALLGVPPEWQQRIVGLLLISLPIVFALSWVYAEPKPADSWFARRTSTRRRRLALVAVPTLLVAVLLGTVRPWAAGSTQAEPRVAVMLFRDDSPKQDHAYLARGLSEELARALEKVPGMMVLDAPDSAAVIIDGTVGRWGDNVRITARLVRASNRERLRSESYDRPFGDVFAMQDSLSRVIAEELLPDIPGGRSKAVARLENPNPIAYDLYLRARYARDAERDTIRADSLFKASVASDPSFARARRELSALHAPNTN